MPFITLGTTSELQIKVPTAQTTDWGDTMRTDTFQKIAEHDHTGSGKGVQLGSGSLAADSVTGAKLRLDNNEYLRARNAADTANINILKINASDKLEIASEIAIALSLSNNIALQGRNAADSAYVSLIKLNASDKIELGTQLASFVVANDTYITARNNADTSNVNVLKLNTSDKVLLENLGSITGSSATLSGFTSLAATRIDQESSVTLTDNTAVATSASVISLGANESCEIHYRIVRNGLVQKGVLEFDQNNAGIIEEFSGDDTGITFSNNAGVLEYTSTSTGFNATLTYIIIKK